MLRLHAGGRLIYKLTDLWTSAWPARTVVGHAHGVDRAAEEYAHYRRMWATLPRKPWPRKDDSLTLEQEDAMPAAPACTGARWATAGRPCSSAATILRLGRPRLPLLWRQAREGRRRAGLYTIVEQEDYLTDVAVEAGKARAAQG